MRALLALACICGIGVCHAAAGGDTDSASQDMHVGGPLSTVVVTATRIPETADRVPAAISVISGEELRARGASNMAAALGLVPGVEAPAGGDAGPSSAVPSFWGLHEFDAFLLVVDGVPWGGAFNPAITTLDFTDTQRVEVLKGAAPVLYGATSFVGVVNVMHYPAGEAADEADLAFGTYGSLRGSASLALPTLDRYRQSLAVDGQNLGFADAREKVSDEHVLYRGALDVGAGTWRIDADATVVRDSPPSPIIRSGTSLTTLTPLDANFNPGDARIDQNQYHLAIGYSQPTPWGGWDTQASYASSTVEDVRGFLHPDLSGTADTQNQRRFIGDGYLDSHLTNTLRRDLTLVVGADALFGHGTQTTLNGNSAYTVPLDGSVVPPPTSALPVNEIGVVNDRRLFAGQYAQVDWQLDSGWDLIGGLRLNETDERKGSSDLTLPPPQLASEETHKSITRLTETVGTSYRLWASGKDETVAYMDFRNAFKPAAIDFGPDYRPALLSPETAQSYEIGIKGSAYGGRMAYQAEAFRLNFTNLVVATSTGALANAGGEKLAGIEAEIRYELAPDLDLCGSAAWHDATYTNYLLFDGTSSVDLGGRQLPLSPRVLAAAGVLYTARRGITATAVIRYAGRRYLDEENTAAVGGYVTEDATLGYSFGTTRVSLEGTNLSNQRPPVTASEFGSQSFYLLNARRLWLRVEYSWH
ncbi:MAG TPA: TonB-dependent receptor [Steroidobacteraceae bacterium]